MTCGDIVDLQNVSTAIRQRPRPVGQLAVRHRLSSAFSPAVFAAAGSLSLIFSPMKMAVSTARSRTCCVIDAARWPARSTRPTGIASAHRARAHAPPAASAISSACAAHGDPLVIRQLLELPRDAQVAAQRADAILLVWRRVLRNLQQHRRGVGRHPLAEHARSDVLQLLVAALDRQRRSSSSAFGPPIAPRILSRLTLAAVERSRHRVGEFGRRRFAIGHANAGRHAALSRRSPRSASFLASTTSRNEHVQILRPDRLAQRGERRAANRLRRNSRALSPDRASLRSGARRPVRSGSAATCPLPSDRRRANSASTFLPGSPASAAFAACDSSASDPRGNLQQRGHGRRVAQSPDQLESPPDALARRPSLAACSTAGGSSASSRSPIA